MGSGHRMQRCRAHSRFIDALQCYMALLLLETTTTDTDSPTSQNPKAINYLPRYVTMALKRFDSLTCASTSCFAQGCRASFFERAPQPVLQWLSWLARGVFFWQQLRCSLRCAAASCQALRSLRSPSPTSILRSPPPQPCLP